MPEVIADFSGSAIVRDGYTEEDGSVNQVEAQKAKERSHVRWYLFEVAVERIAQAKRYVRCR